jgi:CO dehydrogenase maturation factor
VKIAVTGKGGAGKSSLSILLGTMFRDLGYRVLLVDADPDGNLSDLLGIPSDSVIPVIEMKELIRERTGTGPEGVQSYFSLNPRVDDIPGKYAIEKNGMKLLVMGTINTGGSGCACSLNSFVRQLVRHLILERDEMVIMDMEAGIEHLGRGTVDRVDCVCIVTEANATGLTTASRIIKLSEDIGIRNRLIIGNKIMNDQDKEYIAETACGYTPVYVPFHRDLVQMSRDPKSELTIDPEIKAALTTIIERIRAFCERT